MPDDNRFAGLGERTENERNRSGNESDRNGGESDRSGEDTVDESESAGESSSRTGPAFKFDRTSAKSIYVRPETLQLLEDAEFEVESYLRRHHGVRDMTGREFHDAMVRVLAERTDEIADKIVATRQG